MKIKSPRNIVFIIFLLCISFVKAQDTLFFQRKNKLSKEYNIPFNQFLVIVKLKNGETRKALVSGAIDSSIVFKVWEDKWHKRRKKRGELFEIYANKKNNIKTKDSLASLMTYSYLDTIQSNEIKSIFLNTSERQDMRRFYHGLTMYAGTGFALQLTAILTHSPQLYSAAMIMLLTEIVVIYSVAYKTIEMKKWQIKY